jgi:hypothetical protein
MNFQKIALFSLTIIFSSTSFVAADIHTGSGAVLSVGNFTANTVENYGTILLNDSSSYGIIKTWYTSPFGSYNPPLPGVIAAVQNAYDWGLWDLDELSITSTVCKNYVNALGDGVDMYALAPLSGKEYRNLGAGYSKFHDIDISPTTDNYAFIQLTYNGDVNLDGKVDQLDLGIVNASIDLYKGAPGQHWVNGDVNYDGIVDSDDAVVITKQITQQSIAGAYQPLAFGTIPEPSTLVLLGMATLGLIFAQRRNSCK